MELNVAVAVAAAFRARVHVDDVPLQAPDQPANFEPDLAVAVSLTDVPLANLSLHVEPQLMPDGPLVMVPEPVPALLTVN